jgi:hypothetical protein
VLVLLGENGHHHLGWIGRAPTGPRQVAIFVLFVIAPLSTQVSSHLFESLKI